VQVEDAIAAGHAKVASAPWPPLSAQDQQFVNAVLQVWEKRTADIKRYTCSVQRWQFNPAHFDNGHFTHGVGTLKFEDPGMAEYKIEKIATLIKKSPPEYAVDPDEEHGEHWICDGRWIHILDQNEKKALRIELPPEYRDNKVFQSPLPFVFGVKADEMMQRYWIRSIPVQDKPNEVWLEVVPKRADDAGNYSRVQVVLDRKDTLPKAMIVFMPNWTAENPVREIYQFDNRSVNPVLDSLRANLFRQSFIATKLGKEWTVEEKPYIPPEARQQVANPQTPGARINR
jgi:TIGR03009 family protein